MPKIEKQPVKSNLLGSDPFSVTDSSVVEKPSLLNTTPSDEMMPLKQTDPLNNSAPASSAIRNKVKINVAVSAIDSESPNGVDSNKSLVEKKNETPASKSSDWDHSSSHGTPKNSSL